MHPRWHIGISFCTLLCLESEARADPLSEDINDFGNGFALSGEDASFATREARRTVGAGISAIGQAVAFNEAYEEGGDALALETTKFGTKLIVRGLTGGGLVTGMATDLVVDVTIDSFYELYIDGPRQFRRFTQDYETRMRAIDQRRDANLTGMEAAYQSLPRQSWMTPTTPKIMGRGSFTQYTSDAVQQMQQARGRGTLSNDAPPCGSAEAVTQIGEVPCTEENQEKGWRIVSYDGQGGYAPVNGPCVPGETDLAMYARDDMESMRYNSCTVGQLQTDGTTARYSFRCAGGYSKEGVRVLTSPTKDKLVIRETFNFVHQGAGSGRAQIVENYEACAVDPSELQAAPEDCSPSGQETWRSQHPGRAMYQCGDPG